MSIFWKTGLVVAGLGVVALVGPACSSSEEGPPSSEKLGGLSTKCDPNLPEQQCAEISPDALSIDDEDGLGIETADDEPDDPAAGMAGTGGKSVQTLAVRARGPVEDRSRKKKGQKAVVKMKLKPGSKLAERLVPGKILLRTREGRKPLARRIDSVERQGDFVRVKSTVVSIRDAYKAGRIMGTAKVRSKELAARGIGKKVAPRSIGGLHTLDASSATGGWDCGITIDVASAPPREIPFGNPLPTGVTGEIGLRDCYVDIDVDVVFVNQWGSIYPNNGDYLELKVIGSVNAGATAFVEIAAALNASNQKKLLDVVIPTPVPGLTLDVELWSGYDVDVNAKITASTGFDYTDSVEAGVGFEVGRGFYDIWKNPPSVFTKRDPSFNFIGTMSGSVWIEPKVVLSALGIAEAGVSLKASADLEVSSIATTAAGVTPVKANICYDLSASLKPGVTAGLTGVAKTVTDALGIDTTASYYWNGLSTTLLNSCIVSVQDAAFTCGTGSLCTTNSQCKPPAGTQCQIGTCEVVTGSTCNCKQDRIVDCCDTDAECTSAWINPEYQGSALGNVRWYCAANKCVKRLDGTGTGQAGVAGVLNECARNADCEDGNNNTIDECKDATVLGVPTKICEHRTAKPGPSPDPTSATGCTSTSCLDDDPNTVNTCTRTAGCVTTVLPPLRCVTQAGCNDGNPTTIDTCENGACKHAPAEPAPVGTPQPGGLPPKF